MEAARTIDTSPDAWLRRAKEMTETSEALKRIGQTVLADQVSALSSQLYYLAL